MAQGGYRPGSGRKKGAASIERERVGAYIAERIAADIEPMVDKLIHRVVKYGDTYAFRELTDRGFGKAKQTIAGDSEHPLMIQISEAIAKKHGIDPGTEHDSSGHA